METLFWRAVPALSFLSLALLATPGRTAELTSLAHAPAGSTAHPPLILFLHGSGADERDMIGLWAQLPGGFVVVAPRAPFADGSGGFRWYRRPVAGRAADVDTSRVDLDRLIDAAVTRFDADRGRVFIGGFSQGAVMAYHMVLREPDRFRGAAILSGSLLPGDGARLPAGADPSRTAVFIGHGTADQRIPFSAATAAETALARLGVPVTLHAYPGMGHGTTAAEIADLSHWLAARAAEGGAASP